MKIAALLVALAIAFSGCANDDSEEPITVGDDGEISSPTDDLGPDSTRGSAVVSGIRAGGAGAGLGGAAATIVVSEGGTLLFAEIQWSDPIADLDLALSSPAEDHTATPVMYDYTAQGGSPGFPDSPHSLVIENPLAGEWLGSAFTNGAGHEVEYDVAITVFYGETSVPDGYSGL